MLFVPHVGVDCVPAGAELAPGQLVVHSSGRHWPFHIRFAVPQGAPFCVAVGGPVGRLPMKAALGGLTLVQAVKVTSERIPPVQVTVEPEGADCIVYHQSTRGVATHRS